MRVLLVYPIREDFSENRGIVNKMRFQARAFRELAGDCEVIVNRYEGLSHEGRVIARYPRQGHGWNTLNHFALFYWHALRVLERRNYDLVYMRYPGSSPVLLAFLAGIRRHNPSARIVLEVPTYPFHQEMQTVSQRLILFSDHLTNPALRFLVDLVVTFFGQEHIYGIPCVATKNGIDVPSLPLRHPAPVTGKLRLLGVANLAPWHGYDRLIEGIARGRSSERSIVSFDIVGEGPKSAELRALVNRLKLEDRVRFHGLLTGASLDHLFDSTDVGVGSLAMHRLGLVEASSLKTREYAARGIPFVLGGDDEDFPASWPWALHVPSDESPIDAVHLARWHDALPKRGVEAAQELREYATERLSWTAKLAPVLERLELSRSSP